MKKYTLYVGLNDKFTKRQKISTKRAEKIAQLTCLQHTDGATISAAQGVYKHEDGTPVRENTLRIELLFVDEPVVRLLANSFKVLFNQESVAVHEETIVSSLV